MKEPTITVISKDDSLPHFRRVRLHIEGGDLSPGWAEWFADRKAQDPKHTAWCNVLVGTDGHGRGYLLKWKGNVWPSAWPALFEPEPNVLGGEQLYWLTDRGVEIAEAAIYGISDGGAGSVDAEPPKT